MQQEQPTILALGDSLTKGYYNNGFSYHPYANRLSFLLTNKYHVEPFGENGEETQEMKERLDQILDYYAKDAFKGVIIIGGTNDLASYSSDMIIENLIGMYKRCLELESFG
ncbi:predicted protein [Naegleria gruberi]|uniref:Predicted protein n=1 Tax=Naegleria gruberi TaxID=5762 RepID=D2VTH0_NAEGR|nr:uncharacterized protein NAEGRDRAFT_72298 [Naegleria gruberi]EFC39933.1 predicted protein [Naegleria gruberi]|eukprot:XP_002672677.1 predicted protein [Naegleria gruberi strain NEG-M]